LETKTCSYKLKFLQQTFSQPYKSIDREITVDAAVGSDVEIHGFQNQDGSIILTAWLKNNVGKRGDDKSGMVVDNRKKQFLLSVPFTDSGEAVLV
jgi:hypothetical protein